MSEDFVRCYIRDISIGTLQNVLQRCGRFNEWELIPSQRFVHNESYGYKKTSDNDDQLTEAYIKRSSVIAETKRPDLSKPSLIWNNSLLIADVLSLLSIAHCKDYEAFLVEKNLKDKYSLGFGRISHIREGSRNIVRIDKLEHFISNSLDCIEQNPDWMRQTGFIPSIYWFIQALQTSMKAPTILEVTLYWVSLEIIASTHLRNNAIHARGKEQIVRRFIKDRGYAGQEWRFLSKVIRDCYQIRSSALHEGVDPNFPPGVGWNRRKQIRELVSLVLVEMLENQGQEQRSKIAKKMQSYC